METWFVDILGLWKKWEWNPCRARLYVVCCCGLDADDLDGVFVGGLVGILICSSLTCWTMFGGHVFEAGRLAGLFDHAEQVEDLVDAQVGDHHLAGVFGAWGSWSQLEGLSMAARMPRVTTRWRSNFCQTVGLATPTGWMMRSRSRAWAPSRCCWPGREYSQVIRRSRRRVRTGRCRCHPRCRPGR